MRAGRPSSRPAHMRHWWNEIVIHSRVEPGVRSTSALGIERHVIRSKFDGHLGTNEALVLKPYVTDVK